MAQVVLRRLDETLWSFRPTNAALDLEVRILTPGFSNRSLDYKLAKAVADFISQQGSFQEVVNGGAQFSKSLKVGFPTDLQKDWKLVDTTSDWYHQLQDEGKNTPMTILDRYQTFNALTYKVFSVAPDSVGQRLSWTLSRFGNYLKSWVVNIHASVNNLAYDPVEWKEEVQLSNFLKQGGFSDPFTSLASQVLQRDETPFVSEAKCAGSYRFVMVDNQLVLEPIPASGDLRSKKEIQGAVTTYTQFLKKTFGWRIIDKDPKLLAAQLKHYGDIFSNPTNNEEQFFGYISSTFGIDFDEMIRQGKPLLTDHVFKCNIAAGNIEMLQLESLFLRMVLVLKQGHYPVETQSVSTPEEFIAFFNEVTYSSDQFSIRELRGIYCAFRAYANEAHEGKKNSETFQMFLGLFPDYDPSELRKQVRGLTPQAFNILMNILDPTKYGFEQDAIFTGRKITHLGISGYKTMGNRKEYDPSRNLFELLHLFPTLKNGQPQGVTELMAHVVAKKALWSEYPLRPQEVLHVDPKYQQKNVRRVGRVIPFGEHFYYVDGLINDGAGDVNYVLIPAAKDYQIEGKKAPLIKLYRSTASDPEAESSIDSLLADTNPQRVGSLDFNRGDEYEVTYFNRCTMPIWGAYLLAGDVANAVKYFTQYRKTYHDLPKEFEIQSTLDEQLGFFSQFVRSHKLDGVDANKVVLEFIVGVGKESFETYLTTTVDGLEWENKKILQDIYFVGHSLGGALSQSGMHHFGPQGGRIPLPKYKFVCYAYDTPGVTLGEGDAFLKFLETHKPLLQQMNRPWEIHYQFEKKDVVPQGGAVLLGVYRHQPQAGKKDDWLVLDAHICGAKDTATDLVVTTNPTHGRRFRHIQENQGDYEEEELTVQELDEFKRAWWLSRALRNKFKYNVTRSPFLTETLLRRGIPGTLAYNYLSLKKRLVSLRAPYGYEVDSNGVLFCTDNGYD